MNKKAYFVGIKGVGMTALALAMQDSGWQVSGSDTEEVFITDHILLDRKIQITKLTSQIPLDIDLIVYSGAYTASHPTAHIRSLAEAVADFVKDRSVIAVAGVGGKTTTSAMLATLFRSASRSVGYYIGTSDIVGLAAPGSAGTDPLFVVEADEYAISKNDKRPKFALLAPHILITTNIVHDHPDIYPDEAATIATFRALIESLPADSTWIANEDDALTSQLLQNTKRVCETITYGKNHPIFNLLKLSVFGDFNKLNATAATIAATLCGLSQDQALQAIQSYHGSTRRQQKMGEVSGRLLYDDYGHHPHEVSSTIKAFREAFPDRRIVLVFESHTYSRTESLLADFGNSIATADQAYIMPIFESAREIGIAHTVTPESFAQEVAKHNKNVLSLSWENAAETIVEQSRPGDLILTMGAGFVYKLHDQLKEIISSNQVL